MAFKVEITEVNHAISIGEKAPSMDPDRNVILMADRRIHYLTDAEVKVLHDWTAAYLAKRERDRA